MIRQVIWDVDGTLFDTYPAFARAFGLALDEIGETAPVDWIADLCRQSLNHCAVTLAHEFKVDARNILHGFHRHYAAIPPQEQPPFPGATEACAHVRAMGGDNFIVTHRGRQSLTRLLAAYQMKDYFADCVTADDDYPGIDLPPSASQSGPSWNH